MRIIKPIIILSEPESRKDSSAFWLLKTPEERVEAVETIREHHYSMLGYPEPPRIRKVVKITRIE